MANMNLVSAVGSGLGIMKTMEQVTGAALASEYNDAMNVSLRANIPPPPGVERPTGALAIAASGLKNDI